MTMFENHVELTDEEWMGLIDKNREPLMACCANISHLRDEIIHVARSGGEEVWNYQLLLRAFKAASDSHELNHPTLIKFMEQVLDDSSITVDDLRGQGHEPTGYE